MQTSDYSRATGVLMNGTNSYYGIGSWLLRSPDAEDSNAACFVVSDEYASISDSYYKHFVYRNDGGIVPAMWISL